MGLKSLRSALIVAAACGSAVSSALAQFDSSVWPGYRGTAAKRGAVAAPGPATELAFSTAVPNFGTSTPGGFTVAGQGTPKMGNVGCENCHGLGSQHEAFASVPKKVGEATCLTCHTSSNSPTFNYATYLPHVMHKFAGKLPELPSHESSAPMMMKGSGSH